MIKKILAIILCSLALCSTVSANNDIPSRPTILSMERGNITISTLAHQEYKIDGLSDWKTANTTLKIPGLIDGKKYVLSYRIKATALKPASFTAQYEFTFNNTYTQSTTTIKKEEVTKPIVTTTTAPKEKQDYEKYIEAINSLNYKDIAVLQQDAQNIFTDYLALKNNKKLTIDALTQTDNLITNIYNEQLYITESNASKNFLNVRNVRLFVLPELMQGNNKYLSVDIQTEDNVSMYQNEILNIKKNYVVDEVINIKISSSDDGTSYSEKLKYPNAIKINLNKDTVLENTLIFKYSNHQYEQIPIMINNGNIFIMADSKTKFVIAQKVDDNHPSLIPNENGKGEKEELQFEELPPRGSDIKKIVTWCTAVGLMFALLIFRKQMR